MMLWWKIMKYMSKGNRLTVPVKKKTNDNMLCEILRHFERRKRSFVQSKSDTRMFIMWKKMNWKPLNNENILLNLERFHCIYFQLFYQSVSFDSLVIFLTIVIWWTNLGEYHIIFDFVTNDKIEQLF
jgi:hypothetical protein